jgi:hypothetical protein
LCASCIHSSPPPPSCLLVYSSIWKRKSFKGYVFCLLAPLLSLFVCRGGRWELVALSLRGEEQHHSSSSTSTSNEQDFHEVTPFVFLSLLDLTNCHHFYVCMITIAQVYLEFSVLQGSCVLYFMCFISLPHLYSCLFVGAKGESSLLK